MKTKTGIGLIDDHRALTDAMAYLLNQSEDLQVLDVSHSYADGMSMIGRDRCDVYIIDMNLGKEDSCDLISAATDKQKFAIVLSQIGLCIETSNFIIKQ